MKALSINYRDYTIAEKNLQLGTLENVIPLSDGAGVVHAVGEGVCRVKKGDRVTVSMAVGNIAGDQMEGPGLPPTLGGSAQGLAAQYALVNAEDCVFIPAYMSFEEAASLPCAGVTAWKALNMSGRLRPGSTVLVQGTGGVSVLAAQIAHASGCRVIATSSSDEKLAKLVELGVVKKADCVNYRSIPKWGETVRNLTPDGRGVDLVVDVVGPASLNESVACARRNGTVSSVGVLGLEFPPEGFQFHLLLMKQVQLKGLLVGPRKDFEELMDLCEATEIHPVLSPEMFKFEQLKDAYHLLKAQKHFGKIIIKVD